MAPTLLVLAAGLGSRYGGFKQIDPVGPAGEIMLDYAVFDAIRAGFGRVVFVIRRELADEFHGTIGSKYAGRVAVGHVFQEIGDLPPGWSPPPGRTRPWGTGHAVWCARRALDGPFAVINADDFYGADSFARLGRFLAQARGAEFAMVGYRLGKTLSAHGTVSRGLCEADAEGRLLSIVERTAIAAADVGAGKAFSGAEIVSLNCWAFTPALFSGLDVRFGEFLGENARGPKALSAEFQLPGAVSALVSRGEASVRVLPTDSVWFGVTYREDKPLVQAELAGLVRSGDYPARLFG